MTLDTAINNGRLIDGTGGPSAIRSVGIRDGRVVTISEEALVADDVIDAEGQWVIPGIIDIHTHYDIEAFGQPALAESLRHGVTTVFMGSCSLSAIHVDAETAGDLFGRVEAIPRKDVIATIDRVRNWSSPVEWINALESLPLGPNVASFIGHSDMRASVMGLDRATREDVRPSRSEVSRMASMLGDALDAGFVGMSSQQVLFDKLDGDTCRSRTLPSTYARSPESRRLRNILRRRKRVLQSGPDITNPLSVGLNLLNSIALGRLRAPLKTSLLAAADIKATPAAVKVLDPVARVTNALGGDFRWQHLPVPFEVYADGISLVIFEEFGSGAAALHLRTETERNELLQDESYRRWFRKDYDQKYGPRVWHRDFFDAEIVACPDGTVVGKSFGQVGLDRGGVHPVDAFLDLVVEHGDDLRWRTTISNHRPEQLRKMACADTIQFGFSDAGAHLRNMAFYNCGLRLLRHVRDAAGEGHPFMSVEKAVHRLTGELADWYRIDAGTLRIGDRADVAIIDPERLDDSLEDYAESPVAMFGGLARMVNRNDSTVTAVLVSGRTVMRNGAPTALFETERTGQFLRADRDSPPVQPRSPVVEYPSATLDTEPSSVVTQG